VFLTVCHYTFSQLPEPISISTVGISNFPLLRICWEPLICTTLHAFKETSP